ncbi:hypothetical protein [Cytobacillus firmus]|nr:hypothetical protein [Cytobacillus firmus]MED1906784.1 hypothetical protein [Cytobacillus firmus]
MKKQKEQSTLHKPVGTITELNKPDFTKMAKGLISIYAKHGTTLNK